MIKLITSAALALSVVGALAMAPSSAGAMTFNLGVQTNTVTGNSFSSIAAKDFGVIALADQSSSPASANAFGVTTDIKSFADQSSNQRSIRNSQFDLFGSHRGGERYDRLFRR